MPPACGGAVGCWTGRRPRNGCRAVSPDGAHLDPAFGRLIDGLYRSTGGAVALISGRSITDTDRLFPGIRFPAAGQHGVERRDAAGRISRDAFPSHFFFDVTAPTEIYTLSLHDALPI